MPPESTSPTSRYSFRDVLRLSFLSFPLLSINLFYFVIHWLVRPRTSHYIRGFIETRVFVTVIGIATMN